MKTSMLLFPILLTLSIGCKGVNRLIGQDSHDAAPNYTNINPDDYYISGTTKTDHDTIYYSDKQVKLVSVEVLQNGVWIVLQRPDTVNNYKDSYQPFSIPSTGVKFGNLAWADADGQHFTAQPACPGGAQYRLHLIAK